MESEDRCSICFTFPLKDPVKTNACDHQFCLNCLVEWARRKPSCPLDRQSFTEIWRIYYVQLPKQLVEMPVFMGKVSFIFPNFLTFCDIFALDYKQ